MPGPSITVAAEDVRVHDTTYKGQRRPASNPTPTQQNKSNASSAENLSNPDTQPTIRSTRGRRGKGGTVRPQNYVQNSQVPDAQVISQVGIDYDRVFERMENIIQSKLSDVQLHDNITPPRVSNNSVQSSSSHANSVSRSETRSIRTLNPEKVTQLIQGWGVKYDGELTGPSVQEFLYRVSALNEDCLSGDFPMLCKNLHVFLTGNAREWCWRFRKKNSLITWEDFCLSLKIQYQDFKDDDILMEEIRSRKQKEGESFDLF